MVADGEVRQTKAAPDIFVGQILRQKVKDLPLASGYASQISAGFLQRDAAGCGQAVAQMGQNSGGKVAIYRDGDVDRIVIGLAGKCLAVSYSGKNNFCRGRHGGNLNFLRIS
jgi:hypothetical protein